MDKKMFCVEIHGYFLMDNHYHLLIHTPAGNLPRALRLFVCYRKMAGLPLNQLAKLWTGVEGTMILSTAIRVRFALPLHQIHLM